MDKTLLIRLYSFRKIYFLEPLLLLVLAKNKAENKILFIDASKEFKKETNNNILDEINFEAIVKAFREKAI